MEWPGRAWPSADRPTDVTTASTGEPLAGRDATRDVSAHPQPDVIALRGHGELVAEQPLVGELVQIRAVGDVDGPGLSEGRYGDLQPEHGDAEDRVVEARKRRIQGNFVVVAQRATEAEDGVGRATAEEGRRFHRAVDGEVDADAEPDAFDPDRLAGPDHDGFPAWLR